MHPRQRVLIVDDNADITELVSTYLQALGHVTTVAYDGQQCLEAARAFAPTVVVLDIGLPTINGFVVADRLRAEHGNELMLIAATGYGQKSDRIRGVQAGFDEYLVKPIDLEHLAVLINRPAHLRAG